MSETFEFTVHQLVKHSEQQASLLNMTNQKLVNARKMHQKEADYQLAMAERVTHILKFIMRNKAEFMAMVKNNK